MLRPWQHSDTGGSGLHPDADPNVRAFAILAGGRVVGCLLIGISGRYANHVRSEIAAPYRGQGHGTAALRAAIPLARELGLPCLEMLPTTEAAINMARRAGFVKRSRKTAGLDVYSRAL